MFQPFDLSPQLPPVHSPLVKTNINASQLGKHIDHKFSKSRSDPVHLNKKKKAANAQTFAHHTLVHVAAGNFTGDLDYFFKPNK